MLCDLNVISVSYTKLQSFSKEKKKMLSNKIRNEIVLLLCNTDVIFGSSVQYIPY